MASGPHSQGYFLVTSAEDAFFVRVVGLATMNNTSPLQDVLEQLRQKGVRRFVFDLGTCTGFDSTFMGLLLGLVLERDKDVTRREASVALVNAREEHTRLLNEVGMDRVVHLRAEPVEFPPVELSRLEDRPIDPDRRMRAIVTAHENLVRLGGPNVEKFGKLLEMLKRELGEDAALRK